MTQIEKLAQDYFLNGNENALLEIYSIYRKKFEYIKSTRNDNDDAFSDLNICLTQAIKTFDISKNIQFNTYFWTCYRNLVGSYKIKDNAKKRMYHGNQVKVISINTTVDEKEKNEIGDFCEDEKQGEEMQKLINRMAFFDFIKKYKIKGIEKKIMIGLYFGKTQTQIAEEEKCTPANITMRLKKIATKNYADELFDLLKG